jgi:hypothetical protein
VFVKPFSKTLVGVEQLVTKPAAEHCKMNRVRVPVMFVIRKVTVWFAVFAGAITSEPAGSTVDACASVSPNGAMSIRNITMTAGRYVNAYLTAVCIRRRVTAVKRTSIGLYRIDCYLPVAKDGRALQRQARAVKLVS